MRRHVVNASRGKGRRSQISDEQEDERCVDTARWRRGRSDKRKERLRLESRRRTSRRIEDWSINFVQVSSPRVNLTRAQNRSAKRRSVNVNRNTKCLSVLSRLRLHFALAVGCTLRADNCRTRVASQYFSDSNTAAWSNKGRRFLYECRVYESFWVSVCSSRAFQSSAVTSVTAFGALASTSRRLDRDCSLENRLRKYQRRKEFDSIRFKLISGHSR